MKFQNHSVNGFCGANGGLEFPDRRITTDALPVAMLALAMPNSNHSSMKRMIYYNQR